MTQWGTTALAPHRHTRLRCPGCVAFNFEIRTEGRRPLHYRLELDHDYKLRYNHQKREWDLFQ